MDIRRSHIIIALVIFVLLALLIKPGILSALFVLVFMGIIPGTDITLPSWGSLLTLFAALIISIPWVLYRPVYQPMATTADLARRHSARKRVLKQTAMRKSTTRRLKKQPVKV